MPPTRVLYIGGYSRSGSTLLLRLLSGAGSAVPVGELNEVWERSFRQNQLCGCGLPFRDCHFWRSVTSRTFGCGPGSVETEWLIRAAAKVHSRGTVLGQMVPAFRSRAFRRTLREYGPVVERLYASIASASGADLVIDSSKVPQYAMMLNRLPGIELHVCHLIRDARATAYSWQRRRVRPEIHWQEQYMARHRATRSATEWSTFNLILEASAKRFASYTRVRYEDLVASPRTQIARLGAALGEDWSDLDAGQSVSLRRDHTAAGNPARFTVGETSIQIDDDWKAEMAANDRRAVTVMTWPLLKRYGYDTRPTGHTEIDGGAPVSNRVV